VKRLLFNVLTAVSLVLCVATVTWWIRSYWRCDSIGRVGSERHDDLFSNWGILTFSQSFGDFEIYEPFEYFTTEEAFPPISPYLPYDPGFRHNWHLFGFRFFLTDGGNVQQQGGNTQIPHEWRLETPYWFWAAAFSILPLLWGRRRRLNSPRGAKGHCRSCGYDLRATPERCPECGTPAAGGAG
jgi:hypothetical protein